MKLNENGSLSLIIISIVAGLFVTSTGVVVAANGSKPGDTLYSIDRKAETVQLALAITDGIRKETHKTIAEERLLELQALFAEKDLDVPGIANALNSFEEHKSKADDLLDDDGDIDENEQKIKNELEDKKSRIDKLFEAQQKTMENQRESLKKQYEQAVKDGNTALAASLQAQIDSYETLLKDAENMREDQKQEAEIQQETEKKAAEEQSEAEKQAAEAAKKAAEQQAEAEKKAAEQ